MVVETEIQCNRCGSTNHTKAGWGWRRGVKNVQKYRCKDCGKIFVLKNGDSNNKKQEDK